MFEWGEDKNRANIAKHGVSFELASQIFSGPVMTWFDNREEHGELREISIGMAQNLAILIVAHTHRSDMTRIISARAATRMERERYGQALRKGIIG